MVARRTTPMTASTLPIEQSAPASRGASRILGAFVAVAIASVVTIVTIPMGPAPLFALGIPAAAIVGAWLGPQVRPAEGLGTVIGLMATATVLVAETLLLGGWLVAALTIPDMSGSTDLPTAIAGGLFVGLIGLVIVGGPMLLVTTPCAAAWALIVRRLVRDRDGVGTV